MWKYPNFEADILISNKELEKTPSNNSTASWWEVSSPDNCLITVSLIMKSSKTSSNLSSCINHCWKILKSSIIQKILREGLIFFGTKFHHFSWKAADFIFMLFFYFKTIFLNDIFFGIGSLITQISRYHNLKSCRFCIKFPLLFIQGLRIINTFKMYCI